MIFDQIDMEYFKRRAIECRQHAENCSDRQIANIHLDLAKTYEDKARSVIAAGARILT